MLYFVKFKNGKYLNWNATGATSDLLDARFFKSEKSALNFIINNKIKNDKPEVRACPEVSKCDGRGRVEQLSTKLSDSSTSVPSYGEVKNNSDKIVSNVVETTAKKDFDVYFSKLSSRQEELSSLISESDKKQQDILHCIELLTLDAVKRIKLMNALIDVRKKRREYKEEFSQISSILSCLSKVNIAVSREFEYSSDLVKEVLGE